jgi:HSP20 family protein
MNSPERRWDPFAELQSLRAELGRLVGANFGGGGRGGNDIDVAQTDEMFTVTARLPGVAPEEVVLDIDVREMIVRARTESEGTGGRAARSFEYRVALSADVNPDRADAVMDHGLLTVKLPRAVRAGRRTIMLGPGGRNLALPGTRGGEQAGSGHPSPADPAADREMHTPDSAAG